MLFLISRVDGISCVAVKPCDGYSLLYWLVACNRNLAINVGLRHKQGAGISCGIFRALGPRSNTRNECLTNPSHASFEVYIEKKERDMTLTLSATANTVPGKTNASLGRPIALSRGIVRDRGQRAIYYNDSSPFVFTKNAALHRPWRHNIREKNIVAILSRQRSECIHPLAARLSKKGTVRSEAVEGGESASSVRATPQAERAGRYLEWGSEATGVATGNTAGRCPSVVLRLGPGETMRLVSSPLTPFTHRVAVCSSFLLFFVVVLLL